MTACDKLRWKLKEPAQALLASLSLSGSWRCFRARLSWCPWSQSAYNERRPPDWHVRCGLRWWRVRLQCGRSWVWSLGQEGLLEEGMATHSSALAWRILMDRGAWLATVHGVAESSRTARLNLAHGTGARNRFVPSHRACELSPQHKWGCPD